MSDEQDKRIYYQDIVYKVCNIIDNQCGGFTTAGTINNPSTEVEESVDRLAILATELRSQNEALQLKLAKSLDKTING